MTDPQNEGFARQRATLARPTDQVSPPKRRKMGGTQPTSRAEPRHNTTIIERTPQPTKTPPKWRASPSRSGAGHDQSTAESRLRNAGPTRPNGALAQSSRAIQGHCKVCRCQDAKIGALCVDRLSDLDRLCEAGVVGDTNFDVRDTRRQTRRVLWNVGPVIVFASFNKSA